MSNQNLQSIHGYINALPKMSTGEELAKVAIVTEDGEEYHVLHKGIGVDLLGHINGEVEVQGIVEKFDDVNTILVRHYKMHDDWHNDDDI